MQEELWIEIVNCWFYVTIVRRNEIANQEEKLDSRVWVSFVVRKFVFVLLLLGVVHGFVTGGLSPVTIVTQDEPSRTPHASVLSSEYG